MSEEIPVWSSRRPIVLDMDARRSQFKSRTYRSVKVPPKDKYRRAIRNVSRRAVPIGARGGAGGPAKDPSIQVINRQLSQPYLRCTRTVNNAIAGVNTTGGYSVIFDPSGAYSLYAGTSTAAIGGIADWSSLTNVFDQFRVRKATLHFRAVSAAGIDLDNDQIIMYYRYNYEKNVVTPSEGGMSQLRNSNRKIFSAAHPMVSCSVYPKAISELANTGLLSAQGAGIVKMPWCDVNQPPQLYGFLFVPNFGGVAASGATLYVDLEYDLEFRYSK